MLIGALVMAVSLLGLAVVLNSTIHTQNTNPGDTLEQTREVEKQLQAVRTDITRFTERFAQRDGYVDDRELRTTLTFYSDRKAEQIVNRRPAYIDIELNESASDFNREVLRQNGRSRKIVSEADKKDWTLVTNATFNESTPFEIGINPQNASTATTLIVEGDDGGVWNLSVTQDPPNAVRVNVTYDNGNTTNKTVPKRSTQINITGGRVNGTQEFAFAPGLEAPYDIRIKNGHQATGTYTIVVDEFSDIKYGNFADPADGRPYVSRELTTVVVDFQYVSDGVSVQSQITIHVEEGRK